MTVQLETDGTLIERSARGRSAGHPASADHPTAADRQEDPWDEVIDRLDYAGRAQALVAAVRALPPAERDVLLLVAWEQLTPAQAAQVLGVQLVRLRNPRAEPRRCSRRPLIASVGPLLVPGWSTRRRHRSSASPARRTTGKGSMTATASGSSSAVAILKQVNPSIATTSTVSRQAAGRSASQVLNACLERP